MKLLYKYEISDIYYIYNIWYELIVKIIPVLDIISYHFSKFFFLLLIRN